MGMTFYKNDIASFLNQSQEEIFGDIVKNDKYDTISSQKDAWLKQISILKKELRPLSSGYVIFEYTIPRVGGRIDNIILYKGIVFVIEFKVGAKKYSSNYQRQARNYAFDLSKFHKESHNKFIVPVLISTEAEDLKQTYSITDSKLYEVICSNSKGLAEIIKEISKKHPNEIYIDENKWINSDYTPIPSIIDAARILYNEHTVENIKKHSSAKNLTTTNKAVKKIIDFSKNNKQKSICFITGVPGAGKTLAGLDIAIKNQKSNAQSYACFLTGNKPLVDVLVEALARDEKLRNKISVNEAKDKVKSFIQIIHQFRDAALENLDKPPVDNVVIFDEAQRAWHKQKLCKFMNEKKQSVLNKLSNEKRSQFLDMSEPELLIEYMDRRKDWATIVCLVGGGQEINDGEAGIEEWFNSIKKSFPNWHIYISDKITTKEYLPINTFEEILDKHSYTIVPELHLSVNIRTFRNENVSEFVDALLDNEKEKAAALYKKINKVYPICMTRDLHKAKQWIREYSKLKEQCRYGIIASSKAKRLRTDGIWVQCKCKPEKWFLNDKFDIKSSYYMEEVATEFDIQGLEIDLAVVCWDADYRYVNNKFKYFNPHGSDWQNIKIDIKKRYLKNAYRVLLTRAREGFVIYVPEGCNDDNTRLCKYYDQLFNYLKSIGIEIIE